MPEKPDQGLLVGRYRLLERLGGGAMGTVWSARDETLARDVAIKEVVFPAELTAQERRVAAERAQREARAAALIDHPGVITVHDAVIEGGRPWLVMELLHSASLEQLVRRYGPRAPAQVAGYGLQLLDALQAAHAKGILHRDVKPGNVLLAEDGRRIVLTDFGIARVETDPSLTRSGAFIGSPGYAAPERLRDGPAGPESDLWSLAATLYMAVEGRGPFERDGHMASLGAVLTDEPAPPRQAGSLAPLLWYMLQKDPAARPSPDVVRQVLRNVAAGRPSGLPDPPPVTVPSQAPPRSRSRTWVPVTAGVAAVALTITAAVTAAALAGDDEKEEAPPVAAPTSSKPETPQPTPTTAAIDLCSLLTSRQIARVFSQETPEPARDEDELCEWTAPRRGLSVSDISRSAGAPPPESPTEAHNKFVSRRNARSDGSDRVFWGWTEIDVKHVRARQAPARTAPGIGDEAFTYTTTGVSEAMDKTSVVLRVKSTVLQIEYAYGRGSGSPATASRVARWVAQNLADRP